MASAKTNAARAAVGKYIAQSQRIRDLTLRTDGAVTVAAHPGVQFSLTQFQLIRDQFLKPTEIALHQFSALSKPLTLLGPGIFALLFAHQAAVRQLRTRWNEAYNRASAAHVADLSAKIKARERQAAAIEGALARDFLSAVERAGAAAKDVGIAAGNAVRNVAGFVGKGLTTFLIVAGVAVGAAVLVLRRKAA